MTVVLVDAGPLVAFYSKNDCWHAWAVRQFEQLAEALVTCEAVVTKASYLISRQGGFAGTLLNLIDKGELRVDFDLCLEAAAVSVLMHRYRAIPMSLADGCLVRLSEIHRDCRLLTLDSDFRVYRRFGRQVIPVVTPWD